MSMPTCSSSTSTSTTSSWSCFDFIFLFGFAFLLLLSWLTPKDKTKSPYIVALEDISAKLDAQTHELKQLNQNLANMFNLNRKSKIDNGYDAITASHQDTRRSAARPLIIASHRDFNDIDEIPKIVSSKKRKPKLIKRVSYTS